MSSWFLVATRKGIMSYEGDAPGAPLEQRGAGLEDHWVWLTCPGGADGRAYAGTRQSGVFVTENGGSSWAPLTESLSSGYVRGLTVPASEPDIVYIGTEPANVFRYDNRTSEIVDFPMDGVETHPTWWFPDPPHIAHVKDLTTDPWVKDSIFAAVEVGGVMRSDDGGATWVELLDGIDTDTHFLAIDPHREGRVFCATGKSVYVSENRGDKWEIISEPLSREYTSLILMHPTISDRLYVAATDGPPPEWPGQENGADAILYVSEDGGKTFTEIHGGLPEIATDPYTSLIVDPRDPEVLYLGSGDGTVRVSRDLGLNWEVLLSGLPPVQHISLVAA